MCLALLAVAWCSPNGPILMQDVALIDKIAHFDRERIRPTNTNTDTRRRRSEEPLAALAGVTAWASAQCVVFVSFLSVS